MIIVALGKRRFFLPTELLVAPDGKSLFVVGELALAPIAALDRVHAPALVSGGTEQVRLRVLRLLHVVLSIGLSDYPAAETRAEREGHFGTPLVQRLAFDHVTELVRRDAQLVNRLLQLIKLLVNKVHYVLLRLRGIGQVLVVAIAR